MSTMMLKKYVESNDLYSDNLQDFFKPSLDAIVDLISRQTAHAEETGLRIKVCEPTLKTRSIALMPHSISTCLAASRSLNISRKILFASHEITKPRSQCSVLRTREFLTIFLV